MTFVRVVLLIEAILAVAGFIIWLSVPSQKPLGILFVKFGLGGAFLTVLFMRYYKLRR